MKLEKKLEARYLRAEYGMSVNAIAAKLSVSKSSVSLWVKDVILSEEQKEILANRNPSLSITGITKKKSKWCMLEESKFFKSIKDKELSSLQKSKIAEAAVLFRLVLNGFEVSSSVFDGSKTDWIVESRTNIWKIQVKCTRQGKTGAPFIKLHCSNGRKKFRRYTIEEFDFIVGYHLVNDTAYVFSQSEVAEQKNVVTINENAAERWDKLL